MSMLIDRVKEHQSNTCKINDRWYIAKFISYYSLRGKLKDCIKILRNKAIAVHFKEDEEK